MKRSFMALALLGVAAVAGAQSSMTVYGSVDVNYAKETGTKTTMNTPYLEHRNYIGFIGAEDLGGGLKATFQLEKRFLAPTGEQYSYGREFDGAANLGLSGALGHVRFGRVNELSTETYRQIDPFQQYGVSSMITTLLRGEDQSGRLSNTVRYDSPVLSGFKLGASYSLKDEDEFVSMNQGRNGWALSGTYSNGPIYLVANYNRMANTEGFYNWNLGGAYTWGASRFSLGYEKSDLSYDPMSMSSKDWIVGWSYKLGNGMLNASYTQSEVCFNNGYVGTSYQYDRKKYSLGYTHTLSKRTDLYANYAHKKYEYQLSVPFESEARSLNAVEIGMTHRF